MTQGRIAGSGNCKGVRAEGRPFRETELVTLSWPTEVPQGAVLPIDGAATTCTTARQIRSIEGGLLRSLRANSSCRSESHS